MAVPTAGFEPANVTTKKRKDKEELTKIVLRRLPHGLSRDELWEQLQPLPSEPHSFWFCAAEPELAKQHCAFARAYLVFQDEKDAFTFAERFNGYVFVDKQGNESMAIVECAPNQTVPKHLDEQAKQRDEWVDTMITELSYLKFLKQYEEAQSEGPKRVTDFDELVRQLEDKQRRLEEGQVQETPLTEFILSQMLEKSRAKKQQRMERMQQQNLAMMLGKKSVLQKGKSMELDLGSPTADKKSATAANRRELRKQQRAARRKALVEGTDNMLAPGGTDATTNITTSGEQVKSKPAGTFPERRKQRREERRLARKAIEANKGRSTDEPPASTAPAIAEIRRVERRRGSAGNVAVSDTGEDEQKPLTMTKPKQKSPSVGSEQTSAGEKKANGSGRVRAQRNKDRPEREIYRPGQRARQQQKGNGEVVGTTEK